jgi:hypothetical protein
MASACTRDEVLSMVERALEDARRSGDLQRLARKLHGIATTAEHLEDE